MIHSLFRSIFLLISFLIVQQLSLAQCNGWLSPEPICIRTLDNGDIEIDYDVTTMNGATPDSIVRFELWASQTPTVWPSTPIIIVLVDSVWPAVKTFTHVGANGFTNMWYYKIVAYCIAPAILPQSSIIRNIILKNELLSDSVVELNWNWDTLTANAGTSVLRKNPWIVPLWTQIANPTFKLKSDSYIDTAQFVSDTVSYKIINTNLNAGCQSWSNYSLAYVDRTSVEENLDPERILIFPNPVEKSLQLNVSYEYYPLNMIIRDIQGQIVQEESLDKKRDIDILFNIPGYYFAEIRSKGELLDVVRFVKQ